MPEERETINNAQYDWECLYGFLNESANIYGALLCQTLEKVTEQNRHVPIPTVLKYGNFKLCVLDEGRGNKVLLRSTKGGDQD